MTCNNGPLLKLEDIVVIWFASYSQDNRMPETLVLYNHTETDSPLNPKFGTKFWEFPVFVFWGFFFFSLHKFNNV